MERVGHNVLDILKGKAFLEHNINSHTRSDILKEKAFTAHNILNETRPDILWEQTFPAHITCIYLTMRKMKFQHVQQYL